MDIQVQSWLYDIIMAIHEIDSFFTDTPRTFIAFRQDIKTRRAVERNVEIIGEAMKRILQKEPMLDLPDARKIVDTRNRIIHGYDTVSDEIMWDIVETHLPVLQQQVAALLNE